MSELPQRVFLSRIEAARLLVLEVPALDALLDSGRLRWYQIGGSRKVDLNDIRRLDHGTLLSIPTPPRKPSRQRPDISVRTRFAVLERDGFRCCYCGTTPDVARLVVDHVVSVADGGSSDSENLAAACEPCNQGKGRHSLTVVA